VALSDTVTISTLPGGSTTIGIRVDSNYDDVEESSSGKVFRNSSDLELGTDGGAPQTVGIRFTGVDIPQGATIDSAYIQFKVDETSTGATLLSLRGEASDNAGTFANVVGGVSSRPTTAVSTSWSPASWTTVGAAGADQRSSDIGAVIQEIVNRPGWVQGNALAIIIIGTGERIAESYNGDQAGAPLLHVEYRYAGGSLDTEAPTVTSFDLPDTSNSMTVPILTFTATDNVGVAGYLATESATTPAANDPGWQAIAPTAHTFTADGSQILYGWAKDAAGNVSNSQSDTVTITTTPGGSTIIEIRVAVGADDAEESSNGHISLNSSDLELGVNDGEAQPVGIRFTGVNIPQGATIDSAYIQFKVDETSTGASLLTIRGEASDNADTFVNVVGDVTSRPTTAVFTSWSPASWTTVGATGADQRSTDIGSAIQEIVNRPGWVQGNALAIIIVGTGERVAESYNGDQAGAPLLHIEYRSSDSL
jgi:hypothetical protein